MKKIVFQVFVMAAALVFFCSADCTPRGQHAVIYFTNNSQLDVMVEVSGYINEFHARSKYYSSYTDCYEEAAVLPGETTSYRATSPGMSIEIDIKNGDTLRIKVADARFFSDFSGTFFCPMDSLRKAGALLAEYKFYDIEELKGRNWTVCYPDEDR